MTVLEIMLLIIGAVVFVLSFVLPTKKQEASDEVRSMIEEEVKKKVSEEIDGIKKHVDGVVDEAVEYAQEKTERSLERLSNEKIKAVNEYSDTVLEEINKNHKEVMFLYDMLNDKHDSLKSVLADANKVIDDTRQAVNEANRAIDATKENTTRATEAAAAVKESAALANEVANVVKSSTKEAAETVNSFRALSPESIVMPEFDIAQAVRYSQNAVANTVMPSSNAPDSIMHPEAAVEAERAAAEDAQRNNILEEAIAQNASLEEIVLKQAAEDVAGVYDSSVKADAVQNDKNLEKDSSVADSSEKNSELNRTASDDAADKSGSGKVRTLKWAAIAKQQADEAYEKSGDSNKNDNADASGEKIGNYTDDERVVVQEAVIKLHDAGKSDVEIARSLDIGVGEVALIIGLRSGDK